VLADVALDEADEGIQSVVGPRLCIGQSGDFPFASFLSLGESRNDSFCPFLGIAEPSHYRRNSQNGLCELADLLLLLPLNFAHLLHVGSELGLLIEDEVHGASHFLIGHDDSYRIGWINERISHLLLFHVRVAYFTELKEDL